MRIIAGQFRNQFIKAPKGDATRPTSGQLREAVFNICQNEIEDSLFLDLFAGSGGMGLEALSRGAKFATFVELNKEAIRAIQTNISDLKIKNAAVMQGDVISVLKKLAQLQKPFDIIYADPPYSLQSNERQMPIAQAVLDLIDELPLLSKNGIFFLEDARTTPLIESNLKTLVLKKSRRMGRSMLHEFRKKESDE